MATLKPGSTNLYTLQPGESLSIAADANSSCRIRQLTEEEYQELEAAKREVPPPTQHKRRRRP
jgi:hypothetical protein